MENVTKEELKEFKKNVIQEILNIIKYNPSLQEKWVKTDRAREILGCSRGKIQSLRAKGVLQYTKIGGTYYYSIESVLKNA